MKKFIKQYNSILEQDDISTQSMEEQQPQPQPEPETEQLSPEGEVLLVRLLKKALVMKIDPNDVDSISELTDINEVNAKKSLEKILDIMKKYTQDIDIDL